MDYIYEHSIAEVSEPFRGWLIRLLAEVFYLEEETEIPEKNHRIRENGPDVHLLNQYAKLFN